MEFLLIILFLIVLIFILFLPVLWIVIEYFYFQSESFLSVKQEIQDYVKECNELNMHIEKLKNTPLGSNQLDYGTSFFSDNSVHNYKRPKLKNMQYAPYIYNCSRIVCDNARKQPFKYICKYFNVRLTEESLSKWENVLNNYNSVEEGKIFLRNKRNEIVKSIEEKIPFCFRLSENKLYKKLGFYYIDFKTTYFPTYVFNYVSSGGYASTKCEIVLNINNLNRFVVYLSEVVKYKKSIQGQRALMTTKLRREILQRDNYTCQICGNSSQKERNLLLEVDHIIPLSRGGVTTLNNLQTLCWKCNRQKGSKLPNANVVNLEKTEPLEKCLDPYKNIESISNKIEKDKIVFEQPQKTESLNNEKEMENKKMYDTNRGIYPEGQYVVGEDIPIGKYLLKSKQNFSGIVTIYNSYQKFKENEPISFNSFIGDYYLALRENNLFVVIQSADIQKL